MHVINPMVATVLLCGALATSAALAQTTPTPTTPTHATTPTTPTTPQHPAAPATTPTGMPPRQSIPPSTTSTPMPLHDRTLQQQQQDLRNGVNRRSNDSIRRNSHPANSTDTLGRPASASSSY